MTEKRFESIVKLKPERNIERKGLNLIFTSIWNKGRKNVFKNASSFFIDKRQKFSREMKIEVYSQALLVSVILESRTLKCFHLTVISKALSGDWVNINSNFY